MNTSAPRILYVEDEADIREVAEFALEDEGFDLLFCASGQEALEQVVAFAPDLILLDVMMPGMDGPSTLGQLRQLPGLAETAVAFLTAKVQPREVESFLALGALEVIAKPFDPMALPEQIRELLSRGNC
ncbi:MAG: response regulator [Gammaproteobacteria bacterium]|nr:response regulator [Gammaproteobacteria bacterium]MBQ0838390.1 response regulator [Gammaproteobacteria bacterium]